MRIREPFNAGSHLVGLLLAAMGTAVLLREARGQTQLVAFTIYGASLLLLYGTSTVYHALPLPAPFLQRLRTLDHIAIYFLIAGTYTPLLLVTLRGTLGLTMLVVVWAIALAGVPFKIHYLHAPVWLSTATYLGMGWLAVFALAPLMRVVPITGVAWLAAGGMAYTVGAVIFTRERPNPLPQVFGYHGIWHLLVLLGSACHFAFIALHVRAP